MVSQQVNKRAADVAGDQKTEEETMAEFQKVMADFRATGKAPQARDLPPPCFSVKELRDCIPQHCFERDNVTSLTYVAKDMLLAAAVAAVAYLCDTNLPMGFWFRTLVFWPLYAFAQGSVLTGLWVLAHECGHRGFSASNLINDSVGLVLHSCLLVPYHSWRISHGTHHKNTGHMKKDSVFVPATRSEVQLHAVKHATEDAPIVSFLKVMRMLVVGWPGYLLANFSGQDYGKRTNHFEPSSPIFSKKHRMDVLISDAALAFFLVALYRWAQATSWSTVFVYYFVPYLWVNFWLVSITFLQHTHAEIPHYREGEWNYVRGALTTIDRDVGIFNILHHHIADTHVAHHLFSNMPHYHAQEATEHLKKKLGPYYRRSDCGPLGFVADIYRVWRQCEFVDDHGEVLYYKTRKDE